MQLDKRPLKGLSFPVDQSTKLVKRLSLKSSRRKMDIEFDGGDEHLIVPFRGASSSELGFFDIEGTTNKFATNPLFNDLPLITSYQRNLLVRCARETMVFNGVPAVEIRKRISDPDFLENVYQYLKLVGSQKRISHE